MTTLRHRSALAALAFLAAGLSACANEASSPLEPTGKDRVSAAVDSASRVPTLPWNSVKSATPALTADVTSAVPTLPWN